MIITRYIFREITGVWLAITLVLLLIFAGNQLVMLFNAVVAGELIGKQVLVMLALTLVNNLALLLPFAFFIAIIIALGRMHRDSEMIALAACGVGLGHLLRIVGLFSMVLAVIIGTLSLWLSPWAEYRMQRLKDEAKSVTEIGGIPVGTFRSFGTETGEGVFYVEKVDPQRGRLKEVFVQMPGESPLQQQVVAAERGYQKEDPQTGQRYLILQNGTRYEGIPGEAAFHIVRFEEHAIRIDARTSYRDPRLRAVPTMELVGSGDRERMAELQWRLAVPFSVIPLALLAVPLSRTSPRQGRYARLFSAILIYIIYANMLGVARTWLERGETPLHLGLWWVHGLMLLYVAFEVVRQSGIRWRLSEWGRAGR